MNLWSKFKLDLTRTEDKLKLFIVVAGLLIIIGVGSVAGIQLTMYPSFCSSCHEMLPEYRTWQNSSHSQLKCTECHIEPGMVNLIKHKMGAMTQLYQHVTKTYERPIEMPHPIDSKVSQKCHSANRRFTTSGDLIIPHQRHEEKGIECVNCHYGVAHGKIAEREVTAEGDFEAWTVSTGQQEMDKMYTKPDMDTCMRCHMKRGVTIKCEACHKTISTPTDHSFATWKTGHGLKAKESINACNKCHSYGNEVTQVATGGDKTTEYARGNSFCYKCHSTRPVTHGADWLPKHNSVMAQKGQANCLVCHDINKPATANRSTETYCNRCHWFGKK